MDGKEDRWKGGVMCEKEGGNEGKEDRRNAHIR